MSYDGIEVEVVVAEASDAIESAVSDVMYTLVREIEEAASEAIEKEVESTVQDAVREACNDLIARLMHTLNQERSRISES